MMPNTYFRIIKLKTYYKLIIIKLNVNSIISYVIIYSVMNEQYICARVVVEHL